MLTPGYTLKARKRRVVTKGVTKASSSILNTIYRKDELLTPEYDDDGMTWKEDELPWLATDTDNTIDIESEPGDSYKLATVAGTPELQRKLRSLLREYKHVFSEKLRPEPVKLNPMIIGIDKNKWQCNKNCLPQRTQSRAKNEEIERQIATMLAAKVIQVSQAPWYSQVHLTPKPGDKWRFCIDYRRLNEVSESKGWPIPNVYRMLQRLGNKRAKYYAVMDLTSGYHQAPLSKSSQAASAFITDIGTFEWLRVPMGLKGAPSYFQAEMAHTQSWGV
jgi:hypothetical protein